MKDNLDIQILVGSIEETVKSKILIPFADEVIEFLNELSAQILANQQYRDYPDIVTFAYWCRKANIKRLNDGYKNDQLRIGLGLAFHIAPSNVPVNFAFSFAFSLLSGNSNIVRVPSKSFPQVNLLLSIIDKQLNTPSFSIIKSKTAFIRYSQDDKITAYLSSLCDVRIIWGGDSTVKHIKTIPIPPRSVDITFADRFSLCIIETEYLENLSEKELERICFGFYNDTYLMDQNACSSPQIVVWKHKANYANAEIVIDLFWETMAKKAALKYDIQPVQGIDKLTRIFRDSIDKNNELKSINLYNGNILIKTRLNDLDSDNSHYKASFGYFYEYLTDNLNTIIPLIDKKVQTITFLGRIESEIAALVIDNGLKGIDRIVPIGAALDIDIHWDGFDLIRTFSRIINIKK